MFGLASSRKAGFPSSDELDALEARGKQWVCWEGRTDGPERRIFFV